MRSIPVVRADEMNSGNTSVPNHSTRKVWISRRVVQRAYVVTNPAR
jgi:hypothetical protein